MVNLADDLMLLKVGELITRASCLAQELTHPCGGAALHEGVIRTAEDSLRPAQRIDLVGAGLLPRTEILQEPVALAMQGGLVLSGTHQVPAKPLHLSCIGLEEALRLCRCGLFVGQRLGIAAALLG